MTLVSSRLYDSTARARSAWRALFEWMSQETGLTLRVADHPAPKPLEALWSRNDLSAVFMCGWPFAMACPLPQILAVPAPSPSAALCPEDAGQPVYRSALLVRKSSGFCELEDTFGHRVVWTVPNSHSGYNALRHHLLPYLRPDRRQLFAESLGHVTTPAAAIEVLHAGEADLAPVDGHVFALIKAHEPERLEGLVQIDVTDAAPFPPLIASPGADPGAVAALRGALLTAGRNPRTRRLLDELLIQDFREQDPTAYERQKMWAEAARRAGYDHPF